MRKEQDGMSIPVFIISHDRLSPLIKILDGDAEFWIGLNKDIKVYDVCSEFPNG